MAKDAKGHGSEKRGGGGGRSEPWVHVPGMANPMPRSEANKYIDVDAQAANALAQGGGPKATTVPIHGGASGRSDFAEPNNELGSMHESNSTYNPGKSTAENIKAFTDKYGGPRNHAAEQRGFNSGKREINRLRRQGK